MNTSWRRFGAAALLAGMLSAPASAHDFNWANLLHATIKLNKTFDFDTHVDAYMQAFRAEVWRKYRDNEFELKGKRAETLKLMKQRVEQFALDEEFTLLTRLEFRNYDFEDQGFPIANMSESNYWYFSGPYTDNLPSTIRVYFNNPDLLSFLNMDEEKGKEFLARRRNRFNEIDRVVGARIQFKVVRMKAPTSASDLLAEIQSATIYEDEKRTKPLLEVVKGKESRARKLKLIALTLANERATLAGKLTFTDPTMDGKRCKTFEIDLVEGVQYRIDAESKQFDAYLILQDADGKKLAHDDDGGEGRNARIVHRAAATGKHRILVTSFEGSTTGAFTLTVTKK